jgi:lipoprotein-anchoring transpeptidase ErfK/SrfK
LTAVPATATARRALAALLGVAVALTGACVGERPTLATEPESTETTTTSTTTVPAEPAKVAEAKGEAIDIYPTATSATAREQVTAADATAAPDIPVVFLVKDEADDRLEVYLPTSPPGATGWIDTADVTVSSVRFRIEVDLSEHRLRVFEEDEEVLDEPARIGTSERPDPGEVYYLKELLQPPDQDGSYGSYVYGLSGFATSLDDVEAGRGVVGIHGTDDPDSLGEDVPDGCIGVDNDVIEQLVDDLGLPLGTPVSVLA